MQPADTSDQSGTASRVPVNFGEADVLLRRYVRRWTDDECPSIDWLAANPNRWADLESDYCERTYGTPGHARQLPGVPMSGAIAADHPLVRKLGAKAAFYTFEGQDKNISTRHEMHIWIAWPDRSVSGFRVAVLHSDPVSGPLEERQLAREIATSALDPGESSLTSAGRQALRIAHALAAVDSGSSPRTGELVLSACKALALERALRAADVPLAAVRACLRDHARALPTELPGCGLIGRILEALPDAWHGAQARLVNALTQALSQGSNNDRTVDFQTLFSSVRNAASSDCSWYSDCADKRMSTLFGVAWAQAPDVSRKLRDLLKLVDADKFPYGFQSGFALYGAPRPLAPSSGRVSIHGVNRQSTPAPKPRRARRCP